MLSASSTVEVQRYAETQQVRRAEERMLFARLERERGSAARGAVVERFMPLARQLARRYRHVEDIQDLEQVAAIGLVKAIDRFDPARGLAFSSFAFPTILGELKRHIRDRAWSVRVPRAIQERYTQLDRVSTELVAQLGRPPTVAELAHATGNTVEQVVETLQAATARHALSLDHPMRDGENPDPHGFEIAVDDAGFATAEESAVLDGLLAVLTVRERQVLHLRFREDLTQSQIGEILGVSQMHVSRVIRSALAQLQAAAG